jgi:DNA-binding winged helix-turn-helix (wHTH) protein/Tol biopolymer transport system component
MVLLGLDGLVISFSTRITNFLGSDCEFMMGNKSFVFRFADVEVREHEFSLLKGGEVLAVEPKAFRVLLLLLRTPQKVISKEELLNSVWGDTAVTEGSLTRCIWLLRRLLGDDVNEPRFIETVATVGYRLVCKVEVSEDGSGDLQATGEANRLNEGDFVETPVQSARDLSGELKWISGGVGLTKASEPAPRHRGKLGERLAWGVAALCIALLTWFGVSHWRSIQSAESRHLRLSLLPPPSTSFVPYNFAISPDGRRLAFVAAVQDGGTALWIRSLAAATAQQLTGTEGATWPFWSPDSRQVGFFQASKLKSVDPSSGAVQILCDAPGGAGGAWNNRGTIIFTGYQLGNRPSGDIIGIFKVPASGGEPQLVTKVTAPFWPSALPDGDHVIFFSTGSSKSAQKQGIYVGSLSTQESKLISSEIVGNTQFVSSRLYYVRDRSLMAQSFDLKRLQLTGRPEAVSRQELEEAPAFSRTGFSVSDNGVVVFQSATESVSRLAWFDRSSKELEELPRTGYRDPALSRDGALLAVSSDEEYNGKHYIHIYDFARGTSTRVSDGGTEVFPVLSPDGKRVAYEVNNARTSQYIDVAATDGSGKLERLATSDFLIPNDWSADGRFLVYMNFQNGIAPELDVLDLRNHSQTTYATGAEAQFSPDGKWIAFTGLGSSGSGEGSEVYVGRFPGPGRRIQISNHGGAQARWRADGKELFYITMDKKLMAVAIDTSHDEPVAGVPHVLFQTRIIAPRIVLFQYAVSPDGSRFLINSMPSVGAAPLTVLMN